MNAAELFIEWEPVFGSHSAARAADYEVAWRIIARRLAREGEQRNPTDAEINRVLDKM